MANKKYVGITLNLDKDLGNEVYQILEGLRDESKQHYIMKAVQFFHNHEKQIRQIEALAAFDIEPDLYAKLLISALSANDNNIEIPQVEKRKTLNKKKKPEKKVSVTKNPETKSSTSEGTELVSSDKNNDDNMDKNKQDIDIMYGEVESYDPDKEAAALSVLNDLFG